MKCFLFFAWLTLTLVNIALGFTNGGWSWVAAIAGIVPTAVYLYEWQMERHA